MLKSIANKFLDIFASKDWRHCLLRNGDLVMRRRVSGAWEYRDMTPEEAEDMLMWQAIK